MSNVVAEFAFGAVGADGSRMRVVLLVECPYKVTESNVEEWACPLSMEPIQPRCLTRGVSAVRAFGLALSGAQQALTYFVEDGGRLFFEDGSPWKDASLNLGGSFGYEPPPNNSLQRP